MFVTDARSEQRPGVLGQLRTAWRPWTRSRATNAALVRESGAGDPSHSDCIFCLRHHAVENEIMIENDAFFARYDNFPATKGHIEIVPKRHVVSFFDLSPEEVREAYELLLQAQRRLGDMYGPDGYTIGVNEGTAAGRSVDHLHIHLIPRYYGDVPDPRGGIRQIVPNCQPDLWSAASASYLAVSSPPPGTSRRVRHNDRLSFRTQRRSWIGQMRPARPR